MIKYGGNAYDPNKKRNTVRIPGGIGDRESVPSVEEIPDLNSIESEETVVELNEDADMRAGLEMASNDQHDVVPEHDTDTGPTLYDQQVQDAHHPRSSAYHNGNLKDLAERTDLRGTEVKSEAEKIQDELENNDYQKNRKEENAREESLYKRMMHLFHRREDRYKNKRG